MMTLAELERTAIAGAEWVSRDEQGNELGCLYPLYLLHPEAPRYVRPANAPDELRDEMRRLLRQVDAPEPGDVVLFALPGGGRHVGVYLGDGRVVHSNEICGLGIMRVPATRIGEVFRWPEAGLSSGGL